MLFGTGLLLLIGYRRRATKLSAAA
jgi:hypothetical protein